MFELEWDANFCLNEIVFLALDWIVGKLAEPNITTPVLTVCTEIMTLYLAVCG